MASSARTSHPGILSRATAHVTLLAVVVLIIAATGVIAVRTTRGALESRNWTLHAYNVRHEITILDRARAEARASAFAYLISKKPFGSEHLREQTGLATLSLVKLRQLVRDNPRQLARVDELDPLIQEQSSELLACVEDKTAGCPALGPSAQFMEEVRNRSSRISELTGDMNAEEEDLLNGRLRTWNVWFRRSIIAIASSLLIAVLLLVYSFRRLTAELSTRREMECLARENAVSYRSLSARILELQDIERRKIARELHDSVGQYLAALKMNLTHWRPERTVTDGLASRDEMIDLTDRAIGEVRTISHLLHPPLLDELGFESSARWFVEEFSKRSGTLVNLDIEGTVGRLPRTVELSLFRVLQESLTNVHRHAKAENIRVTVRRNPNDTVTLEIVDDGQGIPPRVLQQIRGGGAAGIGLSGMRERLLELDGALEVESSASGTRIHAAIPVNARRTEEDKIISTTREAG